MSSKKVKEKKKDAQSSTEDPGHKGAILKREREAQGIAIETVHEATKIPLDALRAIEEDYKIRTLSEFYYKSFLKIYAKYIGVDVSTVVEPNKRAVKPIKIEKNDELNFDLLDKINKKLKLTKERKRQILITLAVLLCIWFVFKFAGFLANRKPKIQKAIPVENIESKKDVPDTAIEQARSRQESVPSPMPAALPAVEPVVAPPAINSTKNVVLTVRAKKTSWLRVKVDEKIVFQSTLNSGDVETWDADEKIEISGRNISELEFELNGKMIGSLGRASRRAKGLVVTQEGLSVTK